MYLLSFDFIHVILAFAFLTIVWGVIFFRYKKYLSSKEKTVNYTTNRNLTVIRLVSIILSIILLGITLLEPVGLMKKSSSQTEGIDCVWLLDVSASMDVMDITENASPISRFIRAKSVIENTLIAHPENRYGLVIFAGTSRLISPLTSEHSSLLTFLASIDSKSISEGGTNFREALSVATQRFETRDSTPHTIVLLSDGGDREDAPDMDSIRDIFQGKHTSLITIGVGKTQASPIPIGRDPLGEAVYKKFQGEVVLSGLSRENLKNLAKIGGWFYIEGASIEKDLGRKFSTTAHRTIRDSRDDSDDATIRMFVMISFFFFLIFLLLPSSFIKRWNVV